MSCRSFKFTVEAVQDGMTVRSFLRHACGITARSMTLLKYHEGGITREGRLLRSHDVLHQDDIVCLSLPVEHNEIIPMKGRLDILYEDDYLLIVNKPPCMPVHPTKIHQEDTLANIVSFYQQQKEEDYIFRVLNRLDKDTSGCVIIAKDRLTYTLVRESICKTYIAVCEGLIDCDGVVDSPIALAHDSKIKRVVSDNGQRAVTHYHVQYTDGTYTILSLRLETGRTHQIRCHMSSIGHPLAGDDLYGGSCDKINRQALHCQSVMMTHPFTHEQLDIRTPIPVDFSVFFDSADAYTLFTIDSFNTSQRPAYQKDGQMQYCQ